MLDAMEAEAKVGGVFFSLSLEMTRRRIFTFRYLIFQLNNHVIVFHPPSHRLK